MWQKLSKMTKNSKIASEFKIFGYFASDIQDYFVVHSGLIHVCLKNSQWMLSGAPKDPNMKKNPKKSLILG